MSIGYGGSARLILHDEKTIIYEYAPFNLNCPDYKNSDRIYDGLITIDTSSFIEPEIHTKLKRFPNGKKKFITKRILNEVNYSQLISDKKNRCGKQQILLENT